MLIIDGQRFPDIEFSVQVYERAQAFGFPTGPFEVLMKAQGERHVQAELADGTTLSVTVLQVSNAGLALIALDPKFLQK